MEFNIGPRMVKTGLAAAVTLIITGMLNLELEIVAAIASVLAMQPSIMRSFEYIKEVVISNLIGLVFSILGTFLLGNHPLSVGAVVIISIAINIKLGLTKTVSLTVLTIITLMLSSDAGLDLVYIYERLSLVAIGVLSAFLVNIAVFPPNHQKILYGMIKEAEEKINFLMRVLPSKAMSVPKIKEEDREIEKLITKSKDYYEIISDERTRLFIRNKLNFLRNIIIYKHMIRVIQKQYTLVIQLEKNIEAIEKISSDHPYLIKELVAEINSYSENVFLMYEDKIILDTDLQKEAKTAMRLTINNLIDELQGSDFTRWSYVFPVANGIIELFNELEKLEKLVRFKQLKDTKR
ncbi:aromatic acid exporter family protein [Oceanobacillus piezotolerans]|uniref:Aromatic acid exporter family protein n=1 Tax=Oceanobacillus piezotolerans TaxID=2448030 RepID=A0A498D441_9BACI|nr:aromatic acid exporter family protein [Oceanobacillus piezotolerans]RLL42729.1 aromatic acid exporter family protein [Oceanobacillus piezotolerans]